MVGIATVEWNASPLNDVVADAIVALLMHTQSSASSIRATSRPCAHNPRRRRKRNDSKSSESLDKVDDDLAQDNSEEKKLKNQKSSLLRLCHQALLESYSNVDAVFEPSIATFEIRLNDQCPSSTKASGDETLAADGPTASCTVTVSFKSENSLDAKVSVECSDTKLATIIQDCIRNIALASAPISLPS
jgi:hypothetical protein